MKTLLLFLNVVILFAALAVPRCDRTPLPGELDLSVQETGVPGETRFEALAVQPDGKFLVGGYFSELGGAPRTGVARFSAGGVLEEFFDPVLDPDPVWSEWVNSIAVQADGKILIGGVFNRVEGVECKGIARLRADGTLDPSFASGPGTGLGSGMELGVWCLGLWPDGNILAGGDFLTAGGTPRPGLARLLPNGSLDASFAPAFDPDHDAVSSLVLEETGTALVLGDIFNHLEARVDGSGIVTGLHLQSSNCLALQRDGKILGAGSGVERFHADGSFDSDYDRPSSSNLMFSMVLQEDGKVLVPGNITSLGGPARGEIARLLPDGTRDPDFEAVHVPGLSYLTGLALREDGRVLAIGVSMVGSQQTHSLLQFHVGPGDQTLGKSGPDTVFWKREGALPMVWQVTFDLSTNGTDWLPIGRGAYNAANGWELHRGDLPASGWLRARGRTWGGNRNGSTGLVERIERFPKDTQPPETAIVLGPSGEVPGGLVTFTFSANEPVRHYRYTLDGAVAGTTAESDLSLTVLTPGPHRLEVAAVDLSENQDPTPAVREWTVGNTALPDGNADETFVNGAASPAITGMVTRLAVQPDGKILAAGNFVEVDGEPRIRLARFLPDGALEPLATFDTGFGPPESIEALAVQDDGKIVAAGNFTDWDGTPRGRLARLMPNGALDSAFATGAGANGRVSAVLVLPDRKVIIAGEFTSVHGVARQNIARLNGDGTLDLSFQGRLDAQVYGLALQPDGRVLIIGAFSMVDGEYARGGVARLLPGGALDASFAPPLATGSYPSALALQADGKVLVGGYLRRVGTAGPPESFMRFLSNGTEESALTFHPDGVSEVGSIVLQQDGRILIGGAFSTVAGQPRSGLARLRPDGTLESTLQFNTGTGVLRSAFTGTVHTIALQRDGRILLGGDFTEVAGRAAAGIARLQNGMAFSELIPHGNARAVWLTGGTLPDLHSVLFQVNAGAGWTDLGTGQRTAGGWEISDIIFPANGQLRALGRTSGTTGNPGLIEQRLTLAAPVEMWRQQHFAADASNPQVSGNDADPDGDNISNIIEYGGGTNPRDPRSQPQLTGGFLGDAFTFTYPRAVDATDLAIGIEQSADLSTWTAAAGTEEVIANNGVIKTMRVTIPVSLHDAARPKGYLRAKFTALP